jgi:hypothetical protein
MICARIDCFIDEMISICPVHFTFEFNAWLVIHLQIILGFSLELLYSPRPSEYLFRYVVCHPPEKNSLN